MTLDERIRNNLEAAADSVPGATPRPLTDVRRRGANRRRSQRIGWTTALAVAVIGALYLLNPLQGSPAPYLAAGETLVATQPVIVRGAASPEPQFDTTDLGVDVTLTPMDSYLEVVEKAERITEGEIVRITLLGTTPGGLDSFIVHSIEVVPGLGQLQQRCVRTDAGGACGGTQVENLVDAPGGLIQPDMRAHPSYVIGGLGDLTWDVPAGTSVAVLTVNGERRWLQPVSGVAVFDTTLLDGNRFEVTAFDVTGNTIENLRLVARTDEAVTGFNCPVTIPYQPGFVPPDSHPPDPGPGSVWYGSDDLWTTLPVDGLYKQRKSVWWSANFPGGAEEEQPPIEVTYNRLDIDTDPIVMGAPGTNAYTAEQGSFMIAGIDPDETGCWEVTASYKGADLSYIYERP